MPSNVIALTIGDPAGIGPEITAETLVEVSGQPGHHGIAVGDTAALARGVAAKGFDVGVRAVSSWDTPPQPGVIDVFDTGVLGTDLPEWGVVDARAGQAAVAAVELATRAALAGQVAGIATAPINKEAIWAAGSEHLGHTEMLGALTGVSDQDTMFVVRNTRRAGRHMRVFFATRHMSLRRALDAISRDSVAEALRRADRALRTFGVVDPKIAVAALNPHGGENGAFGDEEQLHLAPAVADAVAAGIDAVGPIPADSVFNQGLNGDYDAILSLFHDQGHIPCKTFDFDGTVSVTVGLPILRTSVDHGTAFDIAGKGVANHATMLSAYLSAVEYSASVDAIRAEYSPRS